VVKISAIRVKAPFDFTSIRTENFLILGRDSKPILQAALGTLDGPGSCRTGRRVVGNHLHNRSWHFAGENRRDNQRYQ
jgi:hypothetical protein